MAFPISKAQREHVSKLTAPERHFYFIDKVTDRKELWTLKSSNELLLFKDAEGKLCIPVWPHPDFTQALAKGDFRKAVATRIDLGTFLSNTLTSCAQQDLNILVFPVSSKLGAPVSAEALRSEINDALATEKPTRSILDIPELPEDFIPQP
ncbi:DUF2750 domain-containing protein [Rubritalea tangerina]|uniref:DUF2750 domain-containing protein n=1 Tax=Rubritalea tangerina TaxID=430798 RepID=A0ABW4Z5W8_9BACT